MAGPSGVGKSSVVTGLASQLPFHFSVSVTTRDRRPGEVDGKDRYFVDADEFRSRIDRNYFAVMQYHIDLRAEVFRHRVSGDTG